MPLRHTSRGWWWGSHGPYKTRAEAVAVAQRAYEHGYRDPASSNGRVRRALTKLARLRRKKTR
jgi:hypothetical protein